MDASFLEIHNFIAESEGELLGLKLAGKIGARERPVEDSNGTGEHTLHGLLGQALSVAAPLDSHRAGAADVGDDDGRTDVAGQG